MRKHCFIGVIFLCISGVSLFAQKLVWDVDFSFKLDNREYVDIDISPAETLFGAFIAPEIGLEWEGHSMNLGLDIMRNFGEADIYNLNILLYYNYSSDNYHINAGVFPRKKMIGDYSHAFFSDNVRYYDTTLEGLALQYSNDRGYSELIIDWQSMMKEDGREIFSIYSSSRYKFNMFFIGYSLDVVHHVVDMESYILDEVMDNILVEPYLGLDFSEILPLDLLSLKLGWLQSFQHDREHVGYYVFPKGGMIDVAIEKWGVGIDNSLFIGDNMMPYYSTVTSDGNIYGSALYSGELFYATDSGLYNRMEVYWKPLKKNKILDLKIACVFNFDGDGRFGTQQTISLSMNLNNLNFKF